MRLFLQLLLGVVMAVTAFSLDITTRDGTAYKNAEITAVEWDGVRIVHSTGVAKIYFEEMPESLQKRYHYDASKIAAERRTRDEARRKDEEKAAVLAAAQQREWDQIAARVEAEKRGKAELQQRQERERVQQEEMQETVAAIEHWLLVILIIAVGLWLYFLPSIIGRRKTNAFAIFILNFVAGWTFVGWVTALVWACTKDSAMDQLARERMQMKQESHRYLE